MSHRNIEQVFTKNKIASAVSNALRQAHRHDSSAAKEIGRKTGVNSLTISNWHRAVNAPNAQHLASLMVIYPEMFFAIVGLVNEANNIFIEREVVDQTDLGLDREMRMGNGDVRSDMNVTLKTDQHEMCVGNFNKRQR